MIIDNIHLWDLEVVKFDNIIFFIHTDFNNIRKINLKTLSVRIIFLNSNV